MEEKIGVELNSIYKLKITIEYLPLIKQLVIEILQRLKDHVSAYPIEYDVDSLINLNQGSLEIQYKAETLCSEIDVPDDYIRIDVKLWLDENEDSYENEISLSSLTNSFEPKILSKAYLISSFWDLELLIFDSLINSVKFLIGNLKPYPEGSLEKIAKMGCPSSEVRAVLVKNKVYKINYMINWYKYTTPSYMIEGKAWCEELGPLNYFGRFQMIEDGYEYPISEIFRSHYLTVLIFDLSHILFMKINAEYRNRYRLN